MAWLAMPFPEMEPGPPNSWCTKPEVRSLYPSGHTHSYVSILGNNKFVGGYFSNTCERLP